VNASTFESSLNDYCINYHVEKYISYSRHLETSTLKFLISIFTI